MAIVNSAALVSPGTGSPVIAQRTGVALSGTALQANVVPATGSLSPTCRSGFVRAKVSAGGGTAPTLAQLSMSATDGTTTSNFAPPFLASAIALTANVQVDVLWEFVVEINATSITINTTLGGTAPTATGDFEVIYQP